METVSPRNSVIAPLKGPSISGPFAYLHSPLPQGTPK
jgi:hypothetical protein